MTAADPFDARLALAAPGLLRVFNAAGILAPADVHVATRLGALAGEDDERVLLAAALAVRGPRLGHVLVDVATIRATATVDAEEPVDLSALPWPPAEPWLEALAASPLVAAGEDEAAARPLRLAGTELYLDRYWREERQVAADLARARGPRAGRPRRGGARRRAGPRSSAARRQTTASGSPPRRRCGAASRSSPAGRAPARRRRSRGSSRCC